MARIKPEIRSGDYFLLSVLSVKSVVVFQVISLLFRYLRVVIDCAILRFESDSAGAGVTMFRVLVA